MADSSNTMDVDKKDPVIVLVSGAGGQIGYALCPMIASGAMFGPDQPVIIRGLEIPPCVARLKGTEMELQDCAFPLLERFECHSTAEPEAAWKDIDFAVLVGGFPRKKGMDRAALLGKNGGIFKSAGENLEKYAKETTKVLVVANPANTNCRVCAEFAPKIPKENFCALTRLDYNRARGMVAALTGASRTAVKDVIIWGNHSKKQVPDLTHVTVDGKEFDAVKFEADFPKEIDEAGFKHAVQYRGASVIQVREASSACSAAKAACDNIRDWFCGTPEGETVAMSVWSNGNEYGIADGIFYSFPVMCKDGKWSIKKVDVSEEIMSLMKESEQELVDERKTALESLKA